jgi:3-deoxy-D-manno-octulosonic-acid transferase
VLLIYNFLIGLYSLGIRIASAWNPKAKEWIRGRKNLLAQLRDKINPADNVIWVHCASAGEFEQAKPVIEALKETNPSHKILVSFFSPSGYSAAKKYQHADVITYLPVDTRKNAKQFLEVVNPQLVIFVKYEYWYHHLSAITFRHIPLLMVSAIFRRDQLFFKWYGRFYKRILFLFRQIFVQDDSSLQLLRSENILHATISGDTRFDRVKKIADQFTELPLIRDFAGDQQVIVAGSTWQQDEAILSAYVKKRAIKIVIVPHEIKKEHISELQKTFPDCILYSEIKNLFSHDESVQTNSIWNSINEQQEKDIQKRLHHAKTLIIDSMGMLSKLYYYATITYVGGGFGSGIHNTLEAVVYGKPVLFGPKYQKFKEAKDLISIEAAFSINNNEELETKMDQFLNNPEKLAKTGVAAKKYVEENTGATQKIIRYIQENRLLTN